MRSSHSNFTGPASIGDMADSRTSACEDSYDGKPSVSYMIEDRCPLDYSKDESIRLLEDEPTLPRVSIQEVPSWVWDRSYMGADWVAELPNLKVPCEKCNNPVYLESEACTESQMHEHLYITGISVLRRYSWHHRRYHQDFGPEDLKVLVDTGEPPEFEESRGRTSTVSSLFIGVCRSQSELDFDWHLDDQRQY